VDKIIAAPATVRVGPRRAPPVPATCGLQVQGRARTRWRRRRAAAASRRHLAGL